MPSELSKNLLKITFNDIKKHGAEHPIAKFGRGIGVANLCY